MSKPNTRKLNIWKDFDHIDAEGNLTRAICKFCHYSTLYDADITILQNHLSQHKNEIMHREADSKESNPSVSGHNRTKETEDAPTIVEAVQTTATNNDFKHWIKPKIMRNAEQLYQAPTIEKDSSNSIRNFINHIRTHVDKLKSLKVPVDTWDIPMSFLIRSKLDGKTESKYKETFKLDEIPTLKQLIEFLIERARCLDTTTHYSITNHEKATKSQRSSAQGCNDVRREQQFDDSRHQRSSSPRPSTSQSQTVHQSSSRPLIPRPSSSRPSSPRPSTTRPASSRPSSRHSPSSYSPSRRLRSRSPISTRRIECPICKTNEHNIHHCRTFCKWTASQRLLIANYYKLCLNCLLPGHHTSKCRSRKCRECKQCHHSLLHTDNHPTTQ
ncbi:hypothetical protein QLX08_009796 [Tetragonisca angustula]|uniref:Uncharacterized protein n=1 Tax=Tetragonisca angustula TaxID=166442 RepID=A0AAW0ZF54_9HYME